MNALDYSIVAAYILAMLAFGYYLRKTSSEKDYFHGGNTIGWVPLTLSTMATQLSVISFVSAPAFVGLRENGGLKWLTYELGVPLAMIIVMFVIAPALYRTGYVSIYQYLERRFSRSTRILISLAFQIVSAVAVGSMVYAMGIILEAALGIAYWQSILAIGTITLIYSTTGGMKAVVYGDTIQMIMIFFGLLILGVFALGDIGGVSGFLEKVDPARLKAVDFKSFGFSGDEFGFFPMLFGGMVLYMSYYGCTQLQAQRVMSAKSLKEAQRLLAANGFLRFPVVLLYCMVGLLLGVVFAGSADLMSKVPADKVDTMMAIYILERLPHGIIGILLVAILAAAMSSLSSAVNSLAAVTLEDLTVTGILKEDSQRRVFWGRAVSVMWGVIFLLTSNFAGKIAPTVIEAINKVGAAMYGPVLAVFLLGILTRRVGAKAVNAGLLAGVFLNLYFWQAQPDIFWMWWNFIGLVVASGVALIVQQLIGQRRANDIVLDAAVAGPIAIEWRPKIAIALSAFFVAIVLSSMSIAGWMT